MNKHLGIAVLIAMAGVLLVTLAGNYVVYETVKAEQRQRERQALQAEFQSFVLCRSTGRTVKECNIISRGTILPPNLSLDQIKAKFADLGELRVKQIFVKGKSGVQGPPGVRGVKGAPGSQGARGPIGKTGARGPQGPQGESGGRGPPGEQGPRGPAGARGAQGARGPQGPQGPPGAQGPQGPPGRCISRTESFPRVGTITFCVPG